MTTSSAKDTTGGGLGSALSGLSSKAMNNPATGALADQARDYMAAQGQQLAGRLGQKVSDLTARLDEVAENGDLGPLGEGLKRSVQGDSPAKAAMGALGAQVKDKLKSAFGKGKSGQPKVIAINEQVDVGVPVSTAYDQWTQFEDFSNFMKGIESVDQKEDTETAWRGKVAWSRRSWTAKIQEQVPDRRIAWTSEGEKGSVNGVVTFHPLADDLTRILVVLEYYPSGFFEKTANLWRAPGRRARLDLKHFRRHIMVEGVASGSWRGEIREGEVVSGPDEDTDRQSRTGEQTDEDARDEDDGARRDRDQDDTHTRAS